MRKKMQGRLGSRMNEDLGLNENSTEYWANSMGGAVDEEKLSAALGNLMGRKIDILESEAAEFDYVPSKRFVKKMNILLRSERYFGRNVWVGKGLRTVASIALIVCSLIVVGTVAARVFGINPWDYIVKISQKDKMEDRTYTATSSSVQEGTETALIKHDVPTYVPKGYKESCRDDTTDFGIYVAWAKSKNSSIDYNRITLDKGLKMSTDAEYTVSKKTKIAGYMGYYRKKGKYEWIMWDDEKYAHMVYAVSVKNARQEMEKMANSLYE